MYKRLKCKLWPKIGKLRGRTYILASLKRRERERESKGVLAIDEYCLLRVSNGLNTAVRKVRRHSRCRLLLKSPTFPCWSNFRKIKQLPKKMDTRKMEEYHIIIRKKKKNSARAENHTVIAIKNSPRRLRIEMGVSSFEEHAATVGTMGFSGSSRKSKGSAWNVVFKISRSNWPEPPPLTMPVSSEQCPLRWAQVRVAREDTTHTRSIRVESSSFIVQMRFGVGLSSEWRLALLQFRWFRMAGLWRLAGAGCLCWGEKKIWLWWREWVMVGVGQIRLDRQNR